MWLDFTAYLVSGNHEKFFRIWTGAGNNSKSMLVKLLCMAWGPQYCIKVPTTIFAEKKAKSNQAQPELARADGCKIIVSQEPSDDEILQKGPVKELTGGDSMSVRGLFQENIDMVATFRPIFMSNAIPPLNNADKACINRIRITDFISTWTENAPENIKEQYATNTFKMDPFFDSKLLPLSHAFMWVIINKWSKFKKLGLIPPKEISDATNKYWIDNDIYKGYLSERIVKKYDDNDELDNNFSISFRDIYKDFRFWFIENYPRVPIPVRNVAKNALIVQLGEPNNNEWSGMDFVNEEQVQVQVSPERKKTKNKLTKSPKKN